MKKAFDQTVRDLKREVNKKVLKVPSIEQKILDATSNETWGPHGSLLADIAQATWNYHEYQIIMNVIWKRINDTGKNWRHVYKALAVLEYLVAHGSERVIEEIREHAYQISTLSDFQYIDSSGKDQGTNVRRKSQTLVSLVNDKERISEVRQKALANRDKFRSTFSTGKLGSGGYGDRYEGRYRDEDQYGNGRERDWGYRDDDRYSRGGDPNSREGDRYGRDDEHYSRDSYRDDDYRGGRGNDDYQYGSRNRSLDRDRSFEDDDRYSSRSGGGRADNTSQDERQLERRLSEQSVGAPPNYEEATRDAPNRVQEERNGGDVAAAPKASSPKIFSPSAPKANSPSESAHQGVDSAVAAVSSPPAQNIENDGFDEFDPRAAVAANTAVPAGASSFEMDLFGSASASDPVYSLALMPVTSTTSSLEADVAANSGFGTDFATLSSVPSVLNQPGENPFCDPPFKATPENFPAQQENFAPAPTFQSSVSTVGAETYTHAPPKVETANTFDFGDTFGGITYTPNVPNGLQGTYANPYPLLPEVPVVQAHNDISGILVPQSGSAAPAPPQTAQPAAPAYMQSNLLPQQNTLTNTAYLSPQVPATQVGNDMPGILAPQTGSMAFASKQTAQSASPVHLQSNFLLQPGSSVPFASQPPQITHQAAHPVAYPNTQTTQLNLQSQSGLPAPLSMELAASSSALPPAKQPSKDKFETKSTVWADTLSRGLVNLNISGPKINPHADLGIGFDSINRKEKREEKKSSTAPVVSTISMGKAMGSGSGIGRAGASGMAPPANPMMGSTIGTGMSMGIGMGMGGNAGMGMGIGIGIGMGGYGGTMNQPMGMGMNMDMGMNQGMHMRPSMGMPPGGPGMPGAGYNPMAGMGGYNSQQPYGRGYS